MNPRVLTALNTVPLTLVVRLFGLVLTPVEVGVVTVTVTVTSIPRPRRDHVVRGAALPALRFASTSTMAVVHYYYRSSSSSVRGDGRAHGRSLGRWWRC